MGNTESSTQQPSPHRPRRPNPNQQRSNLQYNNLNQQQLRNNTRINAVNLTDQLNKQQQQIDSQHQHQLKLEELVENQQKQNNIIQNFIEQQTANQTAVVHQPPSPTQDKINKLNSYTPYEILGVTEYSTIEEIKASYKKKVLKYHPDRGGDPDVFGIIEKSYKQLTNQKKESTYYEDKIKQDVRKVEYDDNINKGMQNKHIDKDNFNLNKFNDIFSSNKIEDVNEDGYGHMMSNDDSNIERDKTQQPRSAFSLNSFNDEFSNNKQQNQASEIIEYKEPEALMSNNLGYSDLGGDKLGDYSNSANASMQYTDYKKAHVTDNTLIDPSKVKYKEFKNVNDLKMARSRVRHTMTPEETRQQEMKQISEKRHEQLRQTRLKDYDYKVETQFNKINHNMLGN
jgi:curved DNA-binding protein CbpA